MTGTVAASGRRPPSVRFLGRKVYLGAVVVLVAAMRQGPSPRRVRELSELFGADRRTIARWRSLLARALPPDPVLESGPRSLRPLAVADLPRALFEAFVHSADSREDWQRLLEFLSPITITGGLAIKGIS